MQESHVYVKYSHQVSFSTLAQSNMGFPHLFSTGREITARQRGSKNQPEGDFCDPRYGKACFRARLSETVTTARDKLDGFKSSEMSKSIYFHQDFDCS